MKSAAPPQGGNSGFSPNFVESSVNPEIHRLGRTILHQMVETTSAQGGSLFLCDTDRMVLIDSLDPNHVPAEIRFPLKDGSLLDTTIKTGKPVRIDNIQTCRTVKPSGWNGYRNGSALTVPLQDSEGKVAAVLSLHSKVSPPFSEEDETFARLLNRLGGELIRKVREKQALEERLNREEGFFYRSPDPMCVTDENLFLIRMNQAFSNLFPGMSGVSQTQKSSLAELFVNANERSKVNKELERNGILQNFRVALRGHDGKILKFQLTAVLTKGGGNDSEVFWVIRNTSEIQQSEREYLEARLADVHHQKLESLGVLASGIAHDFNNILSAIMGYTDLAMAETEKRDSIYQKLEQVMKASNRAKELINQILTFSRKRVPERHPLYLHTIIKESLKLLRASLPKTIEVRTYIDPYAGPVMADGAQMHQVIVNLCTNAAQSFQGRAGLIELKLESVRVDKELISRHPNLRPGRHVRFTVADTGQGIPESILGKIFDPFFTTKGEGEGTGMGLSLVHGIVAAHDGAVSVRSTPGQGTTVEIYLPQCKSAKPRTQNVTNGRAGGSERILLIDDEEAIAKSIAFGLRRLGYHVQAVTSGKEGLEIFRRAPKKFDLVITDLTMPEMTGDQVGKEIRRLRHDIPIILTTGYSPPLSATRLQQKGIRGWLSKPYTACDLGRVVRRVLDREEDGDSFIR